MKNASSSASAPDAGAQPLASPCIRVCCLDEADICLGCFRSLDEIRNWQAADNPTRALILQQSVQRREAHDLRFPGLSSLSPKSV